MRSEGSLKAGSFPGTGYFFIFYVMMMERRATAQASAKRECQHAGMSAANVGASIL